MRSIKAATLRLAKRSPSSSQLQSGTDQRYWLAISLSLSIFSTQSSSLANIESRDVLNGFSALHCSFSQHSNSFGPPLAQHLTNRTLPNVHNSSIGRFNREEEGMGILQPQLKSIFLLTCLDITQLQATSKCERPIKDCSPSSPPLASWRLWYAVVNLPLPLSICYLFSIHFNLLASHVDANVYERLI